jgi:fumarate reductase subunit C
MVQVVADAMGRQVIAMANPSAHPTLHRQRISNTWWLERWNYSWFMLREWSSAFVAYFAVVTLRQVAAVCAGPQAYAGFEACMRTPVMIFVNIVAFIFLIFHALSWFHLVPPAMFPRLRGKKLSPLVTMIPAYVIWLAASVLLAGFVLGTF